MKRQTETGETARHTFVASLEKAITSCSRVQRLLRAPARLRSRNILYNSIYVASAACGYQPCEPLTWRSRHFLRFHRVSPTVQASTVVREVEPSALKNGSTHDFAILLNSSSRIQVSRGPVSSIAGSELISRRLACNLRWGFGESEWVTTKSIPYSSNAFGRGWDVVSSAQTASFQCQTHLKMNTHFYGSLERLGEQITDLALQIVHVFLGEDLVLSRRRLRVVPCLGIKHLSHSVRRSLPTRIRPSSCRENVATDKLVE